MCKALFFLYWFLFFIQIADAVVINEIIYAPNEYWGGPDNEWIELYNPGNETIDVSGWIFHANDTNRAAFIENTTLKPFEYVIIAQNNTRFHEYYDASCRVFDESFNLKNSGDLIQILNNTTIIDSVEYVNSWGAYNNNRTLSRKNASQPFIDGNYFEGTPSPCTANFRNTSADVRLVLEDGRVKVLPDDAAVWVNYTVFGSCLGKPVSAGATNKTSFDFGAGFGSFRVFANITEISNYNDTVSSNNFLDESIVIEPKTKTARIRVWTDNTTYGLNQTIFGCVETFSESTAALSNLTLKIGRKRPAGGFDYRHFLNESDNYLISNHSWFNFSWSVPGDSIEGDYKAYSRIDFLDDSGNMSSYNSYDDGQFHVNGLEDLGETAIDIITTTPKAEFGGAGLILVNFSSGNERYSSLRFVAYSTKHQGTGKTQCISRDTDSSNLCTTPYDSKIAQSFQTSDVARGTNMTLGIPVFLKDNCDSHYLNGIYGFYAKAFFFEDGNWKEAAKASANMAVSGTAKGRCTTAKSGKQNSKSSSAASSTPKDIEIRVVSVPLSVFAGESFETEAIIFNNGDEKPNYTIRSYAYNGSSISSDGYFNGTWAGGWDANKRELALPYKSSVSVVLQNRIKPGKPPGNYTFKIVLSGEKDYDAKMTIYASSTNSSEEQSAVQEKNISVSCSHIIDSIFVNIANYESKRADLRVLKDNETEKNIYVLANQTREMTYKGQAEGKHFIIIQDKKTTRNLGNCVVEIDNTAIGNKITAALLEEKTTKGPIEMFFTWLFSFFRR